MPKILVLTSHYLPSPSANGLITNYIINELRNRGFEVICVSVKKNNEKNFEIIDGIPVYRITPSLYTRTVNKVSGSKFPIFIRNIIMTLINILRKVKLTFYLTKFPEFDKNQTKKVLKLIEAIHKDKKIDSIIAVTKPYANISAVTEFKKKNPEVLSLGYYLDLVNSAKKPFLFPASLYDKLCFKADYKAFSLLDLILLPKSSNAIYNRREFNTVKNKIEFVDFPTFLSQDRMSKKPKHKNTKPHTIVITYAGTLNKVYRNPDFLLRVLSIVSDSVGNIELNLYGGGNCEDIIAKYANTGNFKIINHGYRPHHEIINSMMLSDFLVNISNNMQNAVPSKIFEMFSIGKPIINVVADKHDVTTKYFDRYPSVNNILKWGNLSEEIAKTESFLKSEKGKNYDTNLIRKEFIENTPEYTVEKIEAFLTENI